MGLKEKYRISKSKQGDAESFEKLVKEHYTTLFRFALSMTKGNEQTAKDVLQNALLKAFLNMDSFKGNSSFTSWLWVIIKNEFISFLRKESSAGITFRNNDMSDNLKDDNSKTLDQAVTEEQRKENLMKMIDRLPDIHREIIMMIELSGMSYNDASKYLDIPVGSIKSRLSRAREELYLLVEKNMELFL